MVQTKIWNARHRESKVGHGVLEPDLYGLEANPCAAAFEWARRLGLAAPFEQLAVKALRLPKRKLTRLRQDAPALLNQAEQQLKQLPSSKT